MFVGLFLTLSGHSAFCQVQTDYCNSSLYKSGFSLVTSKGCAPLFTVSVIDVVPDIDPTNVQYVYDYKGGAFTGGVKDVNWTYTTPGTYTILQVGASLKYHSGAAFCQQVEVLPSPPIKFTARLCSGRVATLDFQFDDDTRKYGKVTVDWGDGIVDAATALNTIGSPQHTYTTDGNFVIKVHGLYESVNCGGFSSFPITVTNAAASGQPAITSLKTNDDHQGFTLDYQASPGDSVELYHGVNGVFDAKIGSTQSSNGLGTFSVAMNASQVECFQVVTKGACGTGQRSEQVCSLVLDVKAGDKQNNLDWHAPYSGTGPFVRYRIYRNGRPAAVEVNKPVTTYTDANAIECGTTYCYTLEATVQGQVETVITSAPICTTGLNVTAPDDLQSVLVSVEDGKVQVRALPPASNSSATQTQYTYLFSRVDTKSGPFTPVGQAQDNNIFTDNSVDPNRQSYCYQVVYKTSCNLSSAPSAPVCTVWLTSKSGTGLDWTADQPFIPGPVSGYTVEVLDTDNNTKTDVSLGGNTHYEPDLSDPRQQSYRYRIIATDANGLLSYSNYYEIRQNPKLYVPDAFTPNGDGINDTFEVKGSYLDQFSLTVFNRWGEAIYQTTDASRGWDGTYNGQGAGGGQYNYRIAMQDLTGHTFVKSGTVLLIR